MQMIKILENVTGDYVPTIPSRYRRHHMTQNAGDTSTSESDDRTMDKL
jgi:hypothetical protein